MSRFLQCLCFMLCITICLQGITITIGKNTYTDDQITTDRLAQYLKASTRKLKTLDETAQSLLIKEVARVLQLKGIVANVSLVYFFLKESMRLINYNNVRYIEAMNDLLIALKKNVDMPLVDALEKAKKLSYGLLRGPSIENTKRIYARLQMAGDSIAIGNRGYLLHEITASRLKSFLFQSIAQLAELTLEKRRELIALVTKIIKARGMRWEGIRPRQNVIELFLFLEKVIELFDRKDPKELKLVQELLHALRENRLITPIKPGKPKELEKGMVSLSVGLREMRKQIGLPRYHEYKDKVTKWDEELAIKKVAAKKVKGERRRE